MEEESIKLGTKIELVGFSDLESGEKSIIRKMIGSYLNKFEQKIDNVENLKIRMKKSHEREENAVYEIIATLITPGKTYKAEEEGRNLFFVLDRVLKKIEAQIEE